MIDYLTPTAPLNTPQRLSWRAYEQIAPCKILLPTRPQADFADAVGHCLDTGHRIFAIDSGNATGKTTILQNVLLNIVYGKCCIYNTAKDMDDGKVFPEGFFAGSLYRKWPAGWPRLIWYVSHADVLKDTVDELRKWAIPDTLKEFSEGHQKHPGSIEIDGFDFPGHKWRIVYKTINQEKDAFQGANVGIAVIDERCFEWQYNYILRRLRRGGILIHTATPIGDTGYLYERVIDRVGADKDKWHQRVSLFTNAVDGEWDVPVYGKFKAAGEWDLGIYGIQKKGNLWRTEINFQLNNIEP